MLFAPPVYRSTLVSAIGAGPPSTVPETVADVGVAETQLDPPHPAQTVARTPSAAANHRLAALELAAKDDGPPSEPAVVWE